MDNRTLASTCAYAAIVFFVAGMTVAITQAPPMAYVGGPPPMVVVASVLFTLFHLSLLPVVSALDAPGWAKGSGYAWIAVDNVIVFMGFFGVGADLIVPMRLGVHLAAVSWIFGASTVATGAMRSIGFLASIAFLAASFAGPFVGAAVAVQTLGPAGLFMVIWLAMVGKRIAGSNR